MRTRSSLPAALSLIAAAGCGCPDFAPHEEDPMGYAWPEADALFHQDPRWLGGDGAYTIQLSDHRTLWLFGDSFIATSAAHTRAESTIVRNSVALMVGDDPLDATMQFAWHDGSPPSAFFPDDGDHWFWPSDGARLPGGPLLVFLSEQRPTPGVGLGFENAGWRAMLVPDPLDPPASWTVSQAMAHEAPYAADASVACSVLEDDYLVALFVDSTAHHGRLARWPTVDVSNGDLSRPAWWTGAEWVAEAELTAPPAIVIDDGSTECSFSRYGAHWIYLESRGFGGSKIALRDASRLEGPWSSPSFVYTPPESQGAFPFVYAGKGHASISSGDYDTDFTIVATYVANSFTFADLFDPEKMNTLYWPHFVRILFGQIAC